MTSQKVFGLGPTPDAVGSQDQKAKDKEKCYGTSGNVGAWTQRNHRT